MDTANKIQDITSGWTATQDCWCRFSVSSGSTVSINDIGVFSAIANGSNNYMVPLKKGQKVTFSGSGSAYKLL